MKKMDPYADLTNRLFGFTILQAWQYYTRFPKDLLATKCKVSVTLFVVLKARKDNNATRSPLFGACEFTVWHLKCFGSDIGLQCT
jgi:hypothetical protein